MELNVKLKEGFFKTKDYYLIIDNGVFSLTTLNNLVVKTFNSSKLESITIFNNNLKQIELKTNDETFTLLLPKEDSDKLKHVLLDLKSKIYFEE